MPDKRPDVIVAGAGIIGASIAWRLAQQGVAVDLLDKGAFGGEASTAGAGMLAPGGEIETNHAAAQLFCRSAGMYPAFVEALTAETGIQIDYRACGAVELAFSAEETAILCRKAAGQRLLGIRSRCEVPVQGLGAAAGVYYPDDAYVDPTHVMTALRRACLQQNVRIREHAPLGQLDENGAAAVVIAAGAWSSSMDVGGRSLPRSYPVKGHLLGYQLAPGTLPTIVRHEHTYIVQRASGFTIAGSTMEDVGFDKSIDPTLVADLERRASALVPWLPQRADTVWTGLRPAAASAEPVVGRIPGTRIWLAYGHFRNGILGAPATAEMIAKEIISSLGTG